MPTIRILSDDVNYGRLNATKRRKIARQMREEGSTVLLEDPNGVEALWLPPFELASAINTLPYAVDVEFSKITAPDTRDELAKVILRALFECSDIESGTFCGVWIKTPYGFFWYMEVKP